ncbi:MAG: peptide chain release factor N(5)-glutamine methyltransferase [Myxococcaceae bacterium]|nr:peptide chain release factor N(5)-glutamine methyltransferase [Myxococcaceae bacterium]MBH2006152.1 peptide chain release factor N(5)-glutamine methyltransferase [Myxococcaceae bacterium]
MALADYQNFVKRRQTGEPVAYITGHREFYGYDFEVTPDVLIPRPDTELLVEAALKRLPTDRPLRVIDVCTGSGCVGIALARERPNLSVVAIDLSAEAAQVAQRNALRHQVAHRVEVRVGNLLDPVLGEGPSFDLLVANPPYIKPEAYPVLMPEVLNFEPQMALLGMGAEGLGHHEQILQKACKVLKKGAFVLMEIGYDQGPFFEGIGKVMQDLAGQDRVVEIVCG